MYSERNREWLTCLIKRLNAGKYNEIADVIKSGLIPDEEIQVLIDSLIKRMIKSKLRNCKCASWIKWAKKWLSGEERNSAWEPDDDMPRRCLWDDDAIEIAGLAGLNTSCSYYIRLSAIAIIDRSCFLSARKATGFEWESLYRAEQDRKCKKLACIIERLLEQDAAGKV